MNSFGPMISDFAQLKKITTLEQMEEVKRVAQIGQHDVLAPSHAVMKGGKVVGYFSVCNVPLFMGYLPESQLCARDTFNLIHLVESKIEDSGCSFVVSPVSIDSPLHKYFPEMGYNKLANVDLFAKKFI